MQEANLCSLFFWRGRGKGEGGRELGKNNMIFFLSPSSELANLKLINMATNEDIIPTSPLFSQPSTKMLQIKNRFNH